MNEVTAKPIGIVNSCDHNASLGFRAKREKSGSLLSILVNDGALNRRMTTYTMRVAKLAIEDMIPWIIAHASLLP